MMPNLYSHLKRFSGSLGLPGVLLLIWALFAASTAEAQLDYTFSRSRTAYVPLAAGDVLTGGPVAGTDDAVYPTITLPFSFVFNGVGYTQVTPNTNGVLFMGATGGTAYGTFFRTVTTGSGTMPVFQCLFPFAADLQNGSTTRPAEIKSFTEGTAPDRKFIIQYTNFMRLSVTTSGINMQVIFNETTNVLEYHYSTWLPNSTPTLMTVGFRATATDFFTIGSSTATTGTDTTEWLNANQNTTNTPGLTYNLTVTPNPGLKYIFTPLAPAANDMAVRGFINVPTPGNTCDSSLVNGIGVVVLNRGSNPAGPARVNVTLTDNTGAVIDNLNLNSTRPDPINFGQLDTLYFPSPIQLNGTNAISMLAVNGTADDQALNDTARTTLAGTLNCGTPPPYTYTTSIGTFAPLAGGTGATLTRGTLADGTAVIPIPFIFAFNGQSFANVNVSTNGFINFSENLAASDFYYTNTGLFSYFGLQPNTVAAFAVNLTARSITYGIDATTTDFVIEYDGTVSTGGTVSFQYRLKRDNTIEIVYNTNSVTATSTPTVGLGISNTSFYSLSHGGNSTWENAYATTTTNTTMLATSSTTIPAGLSFLFTPTFTFTVPVNDLAVVNTVNVPTATNNCDSSIFNNMGVIVRSAGIGTLATYGISVTVVNAQGVTVSNNTYSGTNLVSGATDTLYLDPIQVLGINNYRVSVRVSAADDFGGNDSTAFNLQTTLDCQTPPYTYSTNVGTFVPLVGGATVNTWDGGSFRPASYGYTTLSLPRLFPFNGDPYTTVNVSTNGYINFSNTPPANFNYTDNGYWNIYNEPNVVAGFARNLIATEVVYGTDAASGDFVIQYTGQQYDFGILEGYVRFQYRLKSDFSIVLSYDSAFSNTVRRPTVGLGISNTNFIALSNGSSSNWRGAIATSSPSSTVAMGPGYTIPSGLNYVFTPTFNFVVPVNDLGILRAINVPTSTANCDSSIFSNIGIIVSSAGINALSSYGISVEVVNAAGAVVNTNTYTGSNLASGSTDTLFLDPIQVFGIDNYRIRVGVLTADDYARNDSTSFRLQTTVDCQTAPYTYTTSVGTFTPLAGGTSATITSGNLADGTAVVPIPFIFAFNGRSYFTVNVSTNGFINFSDNLPPSNFIYTTTGLYDYFNLQPNTVAAFGYNLTATSITYGVDPVSTDFVIEYTGTVVGGGNVSFQYRLKRDYTVEIVYNTATVTAAQTPTVGLGISRGSFYSLSNGVASTWEGAATTTVNSATMTINTGTTVPAGLSYVFTPTFNFTVPANDLGIVRTINVPTNTNYCDSNTFSNIGVVVRSQGSSALANYGITVTVINSAGVTVSNNTYSGPGLLSGQADTLFIDPIQVLGIDNYRINVSASTADDFSGNDTSAFSLGTSVTCRTPNYTFASAVGTYSRFTGGTRVNFTNTDDEVQNITLPFPVTFNDTAYTQMQVSTNGIVSFRRAMVSTSPRGDMNTPLANNAVAIFCQDFRTFECRYGVDTTTGDFVIEYYGNYYQTPNSDSVRAQYRFQRDNTIVLAYATTLITNTTFPASLSAQVGLRIDAGSFYVMETLNGNWANATPTGTITTQMPVATNNVPSGLQYIFTPPTAIPSVNLAAASIINASASNCTGNSIFPRLVTRSIGALDVNTYDVRIRVISPSNVSTVTTLARNVAGFTRGSTDTISLGNVDFTQSGTYRISARVIAAGDNRANNDSTGILVAVSQAITVAPIVTVTGSTNICPGDVLTLTAPVSPIYRWNTGQTTRSISVNQTGSYKVRVGNSATCLSPYSDSITVTAPNSTPRPTITVSGPVTYCGGAPISLTLTSSASDRYRWSNGDTTQSITVTTTGNYYVYTTLNSLGCRSFNSDTIRVTSSATIGTPNVSPSGATTFCAGSTVRLTSSVTAPSGGSYIWSNGAISRVTTTRALTVDSSGSYSVIVTNAAGCSSATSSPVVVTVNTAPAATTISATGATSFCIGGSVTLSAVAVGSASYQWFINNGAIAGATNSTYDASASGTYTVKLNNGTCTGPASNGIAVTAAVAPNAPTIALSGPNAICEGSTVTATASSTTPGCRFIWSNGDTARVVTINSAITLSVRSINTTGCTSTTASPDVVTTISPSAGIPTITRSNDTLIATGADNATGYIWSRNGVTIPAFRGKRYPLTLDATTTGVYTYSVKSQLGVCISAPSPVFTVTSLTSAVSRNADLKAFPVPATSVLNVSLDNVNGTYAVIRLVDNLGKVVMVQNVAVNGSLSTQIELNSLPAGMYQLLVNGDGLAVSRTITKK